MSFADRFASRLSVPASRVLDGPIRDIVQQVLREGGYATPAEVEALHGEARDLGRRVDALEARANEFAALTDSLKARVHAAETRATTLLGELQAATTRLAAAEAAAASRAATEARTVVAQPSPAAVTEEVVPSTVNTTCKVSGCAGNVRSKGFCSAHYQQWRRGTLKGFVNQDGTVQVDGQNFTLSESWAGGFATLVDGTVHVDGLAVS